MTESKEPPRARSRSKVPQGVLPADRTAIFVWQSLVVPGYRTFFEALTRTRAFARTRMVLVAPERFRELGGQEREAPPFEAPFDGLLHEGRRLPVWSKHVQIVFFRGLGRVFRSLGRGRTRAGRDLFCVAEPYSLTAAFVCVQAFLARWWPGRGSRLFLYTAQNLNRPLSLPLRLVEFASYRSCDAILSCGQTQKPVLRARGYKGPILDFPLWYDERVFHLDETAGTPATHRCTIAFVGGLLPEKGVEDLLAALTLLADDVTSAMEVVIAGDGPLRSRVRAFADSLQAGGKALRVEFAGPLPQARVAELFRRAEAIVVPSRTTAHWVEQFGRVIIEAQACGARVVATATGEIPLVVGEGSILLPERDPPAIARALTRIVAERLPDAEAARARRRAIAAANARFSDSACAQRFAEDLQKLEVMSRSRS